MTRALMLSAAYSWFVGLLVVMIVVTALFALILFIALKPINKESLGGGDADYAKKLLGRREAELTSQLLKNQSNIDEMEKLMVKLREVSSAQKLINELVAEDQGPQDETPAKPAKKPLLDMFKSGKKNSAKPSAQKAQKPAQQTKAKPAAPQEAAQQTKPETAAPKEAKPATPAQNADGGAPKQQKPEE